jgi:hypothetical protein
MFYFQSVWRVALITATAATLGLAGCGNQPTNQATNLPAALPKKAVAAKPTAKPAAVKPAAAQPSAKPAAKKPDATAAVAAKGTPAKQVNASSKTPVPTTLVAIPKGTAVSAKITEALASNKNHPGDTFAAVLSASVKVDGKTVIPKGTRVTGRVVTAKKKSPELTIAIASVDLNGKSYRLTTEPLAPSGAGAAKSDGGNGDSAKSDVKDITVPAERRLKFKLAKTVKLPVKG